MYLVVANEACVVVDPAVPGLTLSSTLEKECLGRAVYIIVTHNHFDHVGGVRRLKEKFNALFAMHPDDVVLDEINKEWVRAMHFVGVWESPPEPDIGVHEGPLRLGDVELKVIHTPGHTPGHVVLYLKGCSAVFTGDLIFRNGVGRCDLPFSDCRMLEKSLFKLWAAIPFGTKALPGHGPSFRLGRGRYARTGKPR